MCNPTVEKAIAALDRTEARLSKLKISLQENDKYEHTTLVNVWRPAPSNIASKGVLSSSVDDKDIIKELIYMPIGSHTRPHSHKGVSQKIVVVSGIVEYVIYNDEDETSIKERGILKEFEKVNIDGKDTHFVFTTITNAYLLSYYFIESKD